MFYKERYYPADCGCGIVSYLFQGSLNEEQLTLPLSNRICHLKDSDYMNTWPQPIKSVADPAAWKGGVRNMKSMRPPLAAIFFMTSFYKAGGDMAHLPPPPESATENTQWLPNVALHVVLHETRVFRCHLRSLIMVTVSGVVWGSNGAQCANQHSKETSARLFLRTKQKETVNRKLGVTVWTETTNSNLLQYPPGRVPSLRTKLKYDHLIC